MGSATRRRGRPYVNGPFEGPFLDPRPLGVVD